MLLLRRLSVLKVFQKNCRDVGNVIENRTIKTCRLWKFNTDANNFTNNFCMNGTLFKYSSVATYNSSDVRDIEKNFETEPELNTDIIFEEIAVGDDEVIKKLKLLEFEIAVLREEQLDVPEKLNKSHWLELMNLPTTTQRKKYLKFLRKNEYKKLSFMQKKITRANLRQKWREEQGFQYYGLSGHALFLRIYEKNLQKLLMQRHQKAELEIVFDCSYQDYMSQMNVRLCARQIFFSLYTSRRHRYPNSIKLCNFSEGDTLGTAMPSYFQTFYKQEYCTIHKESFLDLYPREKFVYLSPHATEELVEIDHNDVYIIGAFVDRGTGEKISLAKAKKNNIRMAKFPLDQYINWNKGNKCFPLNIVIEILLNMAFYRDWRKAFQVLQPKCKIQSNN